MPQFLANENVPVAAIEAARAAGHDLQSIREIDPGASDESVLARSVSDARVHITFDKDFGKMVFGLGATSSCGIILMRPRLRSPDAMSGFLLAVLAEARDWEGHFTVAQEGRLRMTPLA